MSSTPGSAIRREADRPRIARGGGASTVQMITPDTGAAALLNGFTDIPPGGGIPLHLHNCEESVLIVAGEALVEIEGETRRAGPSDVVWVAAGLRHRFSNPSPDTPLRIFWTYASAEATRTLVETGEVLRIAPVPE
ncbi:cupin domain-containing protein [Roseicyclus persicicus]|uniref:Cupin domain-containing protein n=1 Tax=Roseicyclus persicicus TaxID=2650661 RepID=A0A7X6JYQ7_9RHOB|nr:cupin domain-containing protein [Roseibacterium persicicum]NKX44759.1 cupin domain-containing protein [Roseibacterium persicicum]